ncbi:Hypothetical Protein FCC1311_026332 [Hondaea fermentalgiana]|uniref:MICOS complex subunit MIC10 n=1 Tax=Hondaea fermentalgiana TaxID=2315210 RepID=A0A2R5G5S5_9STRA|nr:Hypothetical Protein FCC1311_026332 [Hondaea fermentalgiana]|eukprot:GBG26412.1 Hypothetical Protein FCC1311_026332 [Hondaea fermentalgiana]
MAGEGSSEERPAGAGGFKVPESMDEAKAQLSSFAGLAQRKLSEFGGALQERRSEVHDTLQKRREQQLEGVRSEQRYRKRLQLAAEDITLAGAAGFAVGGFLSLVFMRRTGTRLLFTGFSTGCGVGSTWTEVSHEFSLKAPVEEQQ